MTRSKSKLASFLRFLFWLVLIIAALELGLRLTLDSNRLYSRFHTVPLLNEWRNQVRFWEKYAGSEQPGQLAERAGYDKLLGWDYEIKGDRIRGPGEFASTAAANTTRVVALGDSYVYGFELEVSDTFAAILTEQDNNIEVLNMGVPGYGIDQAYLKYQQHGAAYQPKVVLMAIYTTDYERSSINFSFLAKPKYTQQAGTIVLENVPVPTPAAELQRIDQAMHRRIYLVELVKNALRKVRLTEEAEREYFESTDQIVAHILELLRKSLTQDQKLLVLHIPNANSLVQPQGYRSKLDKRLLNIYTELGLDYIQPDRSFR